MKTRKKISRLSENTKDKEQAKVDKLRTSLSAKERERNAVEARLNSTKPLDDLREQEAELEKQNEKDKAVINDEKTSPSDREAAELRVPEREEELARLRTQIQERDLSLRERIKEIFKKYGFTVTAILLAVGTTIGVVVSSLTKGLKSVAKGVGKGLQALGKKIGSILPGLLGSIVSFVFRTAGQVISFLGKNAWLLILAVAAFLKRQSNANANASKQPTPPKQPPRQQLLPYLCDAVRFQNLSA